MLRAEQQTTLAPRPEDRMTIRALRAANMLFARVYHRLDVCSPSRLPHSGPAILICNHTSGLDPVLIQSVCSRLIHWMMAREYYEIGPMRWFFEQVQAIPVERSGRDSTATRMALRALARGRVLGIFPEGRIEKDNQMLPFQTGTAMLALRSEAPVYAACLDGSQLGKKMLQTFVRPQHARIAFGGRIELGAFTKGRSDLESATNVLQKAVFDLKQSLSCK